MFIPPRIVITKKCPRCKLRYPRREIECTHCNNLTDQEVEKLIIKYKEEHKGNANLGRLFIYFAVLIAIAMAIL